MATRWATPRTSGGAFDTRRCHAAILTHGGIWRSGIRSDRWQSCPRPYPWKRPSLEGGLSGCAGAQPHPWRPGRVCPTFAAPLAARFQPTLEMMVRRSCPRPDRGRDEPPQVLRRADGLEVPRLPDRRDPHPRHSRPRPDRWRLPLIHEPLERSRQCRDRTRGLTKAGEGASRPDADFCSNAPSEHRQQSHWSICRHETRHRRSACHSRSWPVPRYSGTGNPRSGARPNCSSPAHGLPEGTSRCGTAAAPPAWPYRRSSVDHP